MVRHRLVRRRRGTGVHHRRRHGRGFFDTIKNIAQKVIQHAPAAINLAKQGYDLYRTAKGGRIRRRPRYARGLLSR